MKKILITATVAFLAFGLATRSLAEPGPIGSWLMDQPVSLWDQGLSRMQERANEATASMSRDMKIITATVAFLAFGLATRSLAEPGPIGSWLMDQPVSLWDQGLSRMQERANEATASMSRDMKISAFAVLRYDWDNNEIGINVFVVDNFNPGTHENCNKHRRSFIQGLIPTAQNSDSQGIPFLGWM